MPMIRKITPSGHSRTITLPSGWLDYHEREAGHKITEVSVEVDGDLVVRPYLREAQP
jgi:hypothetical protein